MIYTIQNRCLTVQIEDLGAQLASIRDSQEFLWQGSPASWPRRAPILFPVIGRLREGTYLLNGEPYQITNHGFARDCLFEVLGAEGGEALSFRLTDSPETRRVYPFSFSPSWGPTTASWPAPGRTPSRFFGKSRGMWRNCPSTA